MKIDGEGENMVEKRHHTVNKLGREGECDDARDFLYLTKNIKNYEFIHNTKKNYLFVVRNSSY